MEISMVGSTTINELCERKTDLIISTEAVKKIKNKAKETAVKEFLKEVENRFVDTNTYTSEDVVTLCKEIAKEGQRFEFEKKANGSITNADNFLYKAKRVDNGEWITGSLIVLDWDSWYVFIVEQYESASTLPVRDLICNHTHLVKRETICRCTGLKDKNGTLIWENDVVECVYNGVLYPRIVVWDESELGFKGTNGEEDYGTNFIYLTCCEELEVVEL